MFSHTPELKYCLRSFDKWGPQVMNVFLVGEKVPSYIKEGTSLIHVPHPDCYDARYKEKNQADKTALATELINGNYFIYLHDDHYLLDYFRDVCWYDKTLTNKLIHLHPESIYRRTLKNTTKILGTTARNYDVHAPMIMHASGFRTAMKQVDWDMPYGYAVKTLYMGKSTEYHSSTICDANDLKIKYPSTESQYIQQVKGREWFSVDNLAWDDMGEMEHFLKNLYPDKSRWEK